MTNEEEKMTIPLSDQLVAMLHRVVAEGSALTFEKVALLAAAIRDLELAALASAIRISVGTISAVTVEKIGKADLSASSQPSNPLCACGRPAMMGRIVDGDLRHVCLEHATDEVAP